MSGVVRTVKKAFRKNPILTTIVVGAAIWFTAGTAAAYFAAPQAGLGSAMSTSASGMWSTVSGAFGGGGGGSGAAAAGETATAGGVQGAIEGTVASAAGTAPVAPAATAINVAADHAAVAGATGAAGGAGGGGLIKGAMGFIKENPIPTLLLGQGISGAISAKEERKAMEREDEYRRSRGLMGVDYGGDYQGQPRGIVAAQASQAPAAQGVAAPQQQSVRPINRSNLTELQKQGLIARR